METLDLGAWVDLLLPVAPALKPHLRERFFDATATPAERVNAALVLARCADSALFTELLLEADARQFSMLFSAAPSHREAVVKAARGALSRGKGAPAGDDGLHLRRRARNAAIALLRLGRAEDVETLLSISADPTVRTMVILEMRDFGIPPEQVLDVLSGWKDPTARQALLLALEPYRVRELSPATSRSLSDLLAKTDPRRASPGRPRRGRVAAAAMGTRPPPGRVVARPSPRGAPRGRAPPGPRLVDHPSWPHDDRGPRPGGQQAPPLRAEYTRGHHASISGVPARRRLRRGPSFGRRSRPRQQSYVRRCDAVLSVAERAGGGARGTDVLPAARRDRRGRRDAPRGAANADRLSVADRGRMGTRRPGRFDDPLVLRRRRGAPPPFRLVCDQLRGSIAQGRDAPAESIGALRHPGQHERMVPSRRDHGTRWRANTCCEEAATIIPPVDVESSASYHQSKAGYSFNGFRLARTIATGR